MSFFRAFLRLFFLALLLVHLCPLAGGDVIDVSEKKPFAKTNPIVFLDDKGQPSGATIVCDFGDVDQLDYTEFDQENRDLSTGKPYDEFLRGAGVKRNFTLFNKSTKALTLLDAKVDCVCLQIKVVKKNKFLSLPYVIPPSGKLDVVVALDNLLMRPGHYQGVLQVLGSTEKKARPAVVATVQVKANLRSGVEITPSVIKFGNILQSKVQRTFRVSIDKRLALNIPPGVPLAFTITNPAITLEKLKVLQGGKEVHIKGNTVVFALDGGQKLSQDVLIEGVLNARQNTDLGTINDTLSLILSGFPRLSLLESAKVHLTGKQNRRVHVRSSNNVPRFAPQK